MEPPDISWQLMTFKEKKFSSCLQMLIQGFLSSPQQASNEWVKIYAIYTFEGTYSIIEF